MSDHTLTVTVKITNRRGLDPKVASELAVIATRFGCQEVSLFWHEQKIDVKSIVAMLSIEIHKGDKVRLLASGENAQKTVDALIEVLQGEA